MRGFGAFLRKEFTEIRRTWRIWVLPGIVLFFALTGPIMVKMTPQLLESIGTGQEGVIIQMPDPTYVQAFTEWADNLSQMVLFAVIIMFGGMISAEKKSGTAILVLTKPITRSAFVVAKFISNAALLVGAVVLGTLVNWGVTYLAFGEAPPEAMLASTGVFLVTGVMFLGLMTLFSSTLDSQAAAAGLGLAAFIVLTILTIWGPALEFTPAGLIGAPSAIAAGRDHAVLWPLITGSVVALAGVLGATAVFARREL